MAEGRRADLEVTDLIIILVKLLLGIVKRIVVVMIRGLFIGKYGCLPATGSGPACQDHRKV